MVRRHSSSVSATNAFLLTIPALLTRTSIFPNRSVAAATCPIDLSGLGHIGLERISLGPGCANGFTVSARVVCDDVVGGDAGPLSGKRQSSGAAYTTSRTRPR